VGRIGKNKTLVSISVPVQWREEIDRRAAALSLTRAAYVTRIIELWWMRDCPAVSEPDRLMQINAKPNSQAANMPESSQSQPQSSREKTLTTTSKAKQY